MSWYTSTCIETHAVAKRQDDIRIGCTIDDTTMQDLYTTKEVSIEDIQYVAFVDHDAIKFCVRNTIITEHSKYLVCSDCSSYNSNNKQEAPTHGY